MPLYVNYMPFTISGPFKGHNGHKCMKVNWNQPGQLSAVPQIPGNVEVEKGPVYKFLHLHLGCCTVGYGVSVGDEKMQRHCNVCRKLGVIGWASTSRLQPPCDGC